jgi:hypothetical protein
MEAGKTTLERAFELARSGRFSTVSELKLAVAAEGYDRKQLEGGALSRQLSARPRWLPPRAVDLPALDKGSSIGTHC